MRRDDLFFEQLFRKEMRERSLPEMGASGSWTGNLYRRDPERPAEKTRKSNGAQSRKPQWIVDRPSEQAGSSPSPLIPAQGEGDESDVFVVVYE